MTDSRTISSLLIPMQQKPLLVPTACVVDIIDYTRPSGRKHTEDWYLGEVTWRGLQIPLIAFERLNKRRFAEFSASARLAIMNTVTENAEIPFYAVVIQGTPQSMEVLPADVQATETEPGIADKMEVTVNRLPCSIPDLERVDKKLQSLTASNPADHPTDTATA